MCEFDVVVVLDLLVDGERVSSTQIRSWVSAGKLDKVNAALEGGWVTKITIGSDGLLEFEEGAILPPPGRYLANIWSETGCMIGIVRTELRAGRIASFVGDEMRAGSYLISDWKHAD